MPVLTSEAQRALIPTRTVTRGPRAGEQVPLYEVRFPGWDDVIHLVPTAAQTPEQVRAAKLKQILDFQRSPTPEIAQHFASLATQVDNVQDALVALSVLGRVATKVAGRAIPGVGAIATAADVLNAINIFYPPLPGIHSLPTVAGTKAIYDAALVSTGRGLSGLVGHYTSGGQRLRRWLASKEHKRQIGLLALMSGGTYLQRLNETLKTGKIGFGWGEALQILQTTDSMYGFGLSLGPVFGALTDAMFGLLRGARFDVSGPAQLVGEAVAPLNALLLEPFLGPEYSMQAYYDRAAKIHLALDVPGLFPTIDWLQGKPAGSFEKDLALVTEPIVSPVDKVVVATANAVGAAYNAGLWAAKKVFSAGAWLVGVRGALSWDLHVELLAAQTLALQHVAPLMQQIEWSRLVLPDVSRVGRQPALPFLDIEAATSIAELTSRLREGPARIPLDWRAEAPSADAALFMESLLATHVEVLLQALEGPRAAVSGRSSDSARALLAMHDHNLLPPFDRSSRETATYIARVSDLVKSSESVLPPRALMERAWLESFPNSSLG